MGASPHRRVAWILLLAALLQPGWAVAHALVHEHLASHHRERPAIPHGEAAPSFAAEERPHDHGHLDDALFLASRGIDAAQLTALPSASPSPRAVATQECPVPREAAPSRASPEASGPSDPRAPPIA